MGCFFTMIKSYKIKSKLTNVIVFLAGLISYIGKDTLLAILPEKYRNLVPIIVLIAGYIAVQATENTRVARAEELAIMNYQQDSYDTTPPNPKNESGDDNDSCQ